MKRTVSASLEVTVVSPGRIAVQIGVADPAGHGAREQLAVTLGSVELGWAEIAVPHGGRIWVIDAPAGSLHLAYRAELDRAAPVPVPGIGDELLYLRPSRYCESDRLYGFAARHFRHIVEPRDILSAVSSWVGTQLEYVAGSSGPADGAVDTLLAGRGVCRDYAHLVVALLRALEIPARVAAVYAPGLDPMDFHAVAEAFVDGSWYVVDTTLLAPRRSLVRVATGRDASDISFLSSNRGALTLETMDITATVAGELPPDDINSLVQLI